MSRTVEVEFNRDDPKFEKGQFVQDVENSDIVFRIDAVEWDHFVGYIYYGYAIKNAWGRGMSFEANLILV